MKLQNILCLTTVRGSTLARHRLRIFYFPKPWCCRRVSSHLSGNRETIMYLRTRDQRLLTLLRFGRSQSGFENGTYQRPPRTLVFIKIV